MNRSTGAALLFVGCILIYLSVFGITGFGFRFALGSSFTDTFNTIDTTRWTIFKDPIYSGQLYADGVLHFDWSSKPTGQGTEGWESVTFFSIAMYDFSQSGSLTVDIVSMTGGTGKIRVFDLGLSDGGWESSTARRICVRKNGRANYYCISDSSKSPAEFNTQAFVKYPGSLKIEVDKTTGKLIFYVDGAKLGDYANTWSTSQLYVYMRAVVDWTYYGHLTVDNYQVVAGSAPPPGTGNLQVIGYADQTAVQFSAYYVGPSGQGPTVTVPASGYTWSNLATGTYTVYGTYNSIQKNQQVTVVAGQTASATLTFAGTPPQETPDFLKWIKDLLNNATVKSLMLIGGIGMAGLGLIGLIIPSKKSYPSPPPSYYQHTLFLLNRHG